MRVLGSQAGRSRRVQVNKEPQLLCLEIKRGAPAGSARLPELQAVMGPQWTARSGKAMHMLGRGHGTCRGTRHVWQWVRRCPWPAVSVPGQEGCDAAGVPVEADRSGVAGHEVGVESGAWRNPSPNERAAWHEAVFTELVGKSECFM